jgi:hypothetical protein
MTTAIYTLPCGQKGGLIFRAFFLDGSPQERIRVHLVRDELFTVS